MSKMIPLHIADQAVAACEAEIQKLREDLTKFKAEADQSKAEVARLHAEVERWKKRYEGTAEAKMHREIYGIPKEGQR